ncbi:MAG: DUF4416 family protein [Caldimicrobium sp.]|nr:DUF4416 family protein [Caldimicrobium sp.]MCX7873447.1 DUF4416 family protein [Caldimicrobium sp.]MDW8095042.1 DUF4416 family protein [Caldimicrobium sp.]
MSHPKTPLPVLFFIAVMEKERGLFEGVKRELEEDLGLVLLQSRTYDISAYTTYYEKEMGKPLWKTFYFFEKLKEPEFLIALKHRCYLIERQWVDSGDKRSLNLDPGYLNLSKVVLSTFKDYAHRLYLGNSVYGEVTLIFRDKSFQSLPWTYPDYRASHTIDVFNQARTIYKERIHAYR